MYVLFTIIVFDSILYFRSPKNGAFIQQKIIVMNNHPFVSKKTVGKLKDAQINNYN